MKKLNILSVVSFIIYSIVFSACSNKKYDIKRVNDKIIIEMPKPTTSNWGWGPQIDWHGVKLEKIPNDVYKKIKNERYRNRIELVLRLVKKDNDQYGNCSIKTKDYSLGIFDIYEVRKFQDKDYFNAHYHIDRKIEDIILKPYREIDNGTKQPSSQVGNMKFYNMEDDWD